MTIWYSHCASCLIQTLYHFLRVLRIQNLTTLKSVSFFVSSSLKRLNKSPLSDPFVAFRYSMNRFRNGELHSIPPFKTTEDVAYRLHNRMSLPKTDTPDIANVQSIELC